MTTRTFKIVKVSPVDKGVEYAEGRYTGRGPLQAARKAFGQYCKKSGHDRCVRQFTIEEVTRGSAKKQYIYSGERKKLSKPKEIQRGNAVYTVKHENAVKRVKAPAKRKSKKASKKPSKRKSKKASSQKQIAPRYGSLPLRPLTFEGYGSVPGK